MSKRVGNFRHNLAAASQKIIMMRMTSGLASSPWCVAFSSISLGDLTQWTHCLLLLEKYISSPWTLWSEFQRNCSKLSKMFVCLIRDHVVLLFSRYFWEISHNDAYCCWKNTSAAPGHNVMNFQQIVQNLCLFNPGVWPQPPGVSICPWSFVLCIHVSGISENKQTGGATVWNKNTWSMLNTQRGMAENYTPNQNVWPKHFRIRWFMPSFGVCSIWWHKIKQNCITAKFIDIHLIQTDISKQVWTRLANLFLLCHVDGQQLLARVIPEVKQKKYFEAISSNTIL